MDQQSNPLRGAETLAPNNSPLKFRLATESATVRLGAITLTRRGERIVFTGNHSLDYEESTGDRLIAHAKGYVGFTVAERRKAND
jgi:hypothetical protein